MAKSVSQTMEELRQELAQWKQKVEHSGPDSAPNIEIIQRWIADAEAILARWDKTAES